MIFHKQFKGLALCFSIALIAPTLALAGASTFQSAELHSINGGLAVGGGTLNRSANSIQVRVTATGLETTSVYSAWFIIFNAPENCADGPGNCAPPDVGNPETKAGVRNAGGFVSGADGSGYFTGTLGSGAAPDGMAGFGRLMNGNNAEIHIVLQTHGAPVDGTVGFHMSNPLTPVADRAFLVFPPPM
jgi:hypothetical protein